MGDIDLGDLDLSGLEDAYKNNTLHVVAPKQIHLLTDILNSARTRARLGIITNNPKEQKIVSMNLKREARKHTYIEFPPFELGSWNPDNIPSLRNSSLPTQLLINEGDLLEHKRNQQSQ